MSGNAKADAERRKQFKRAFARELRNNATEAERILWSLLRGSQMEGLKFRRQQPVGPYIADFLCPRLKLIIELDGSQHNRVDIAKFDRERTEWLEVRGFHVVRFANADVLTKRHEAADTIWRTARRLGYQARSR
ncbi:MAG TPA: endonuclease domain-containing protein [Rhizomicrobium sp.]|nr:endonuclease domain-containing protein [Rhizomicrobium sp.]